MMKMMSLIMIICATNAIDISGSIKPNNNNNNNKVLAALNAKVKMTDKPGNYDALLEELWGVADNTATKGVPFSEQQFPYHGQTHAESFRGCSKKAIEDAGGDWMAQAVADVYGYYHDYGYLEAVKEQKYEGSKAVMADVWASTKTGPLLTGEKLGKLHEQASIRLADAAVKKAKDAWKANGKHTGANKDMYDVLNNDAFKIFGHALIGGTPGPIQAKVDAYNEGMETKLDTAALWTSIVRTDTSDEGRKKQGAEEIAKVKAALKAASGTVWGTDAQAFFEAAHAGDFCYLKDSTSVCQQMNCFAEFFSYGGAEVSMSRTPTNPDTASDHTLLKELGYFVGGQEGFIKFFAYPKNAELDKMGTILKAVVDDATAKTVTTLAAFQARLKDQVPAFADKCKWDGTKHSFQIK